MIDINNKMKMSLYDVSTDYIYYWRQFSFFQDILQQTNYITSKINNHTQKHIIYEKS